MQFRTDPIFEITDSRGKPYTETEARAVWESGSVSDCSVSFLRLVHFDFDQAAAKASYANSAEYNIDMKAVIASLGKPSARAGGPAS